LVSFSGVEQQIKTNSQLATLISGQSSGEAIAALPAIGRAIEYQGNKSVLEKGGATFSYTPPASTAAATLSILDASGNVVLSGKGDPSAGRHSFTWNGQTANGSP